MAVIETDSKKIKEKPKTEVIGGNFDFDIEIGEGIDANATTVENVGDDAHDIPAEEPAVEEPTAEEPTVAEVGDNVSDIPAEEPAVDNVVVGANDIPAEEATAKSEVDLAVNVLKFDLNENRINTAEKQDSVGERISVSKEQYQQAFRDEICPEIGVYDKSKIIQNISSIEKANEEGMFKDAGTLVKIMQENDIPLPGNKENGEMQNIIIKDETEYTVLFTESPGFAKISAAELSACKEDILEAVDEQDLRNKIAEKGIGQQQENDNKSVENVNSVHSQTRESAELSQTSSELSR